MQADFPKQILGHFDIGGKQYSGMATLEGAESRLEIFFDEPIPSEDRLLIAIHGISKNGEKITACECVGGTGSAYYHGTRREVLSVFPHYFALGPEHIYPLERHINCVSYTFPHGVDLFYDRKVAGTLQDTPQLRTLISERLGKAADDPEIAHAFVYYWTRRGPIIDVSHQNMRVRAAKAFSHRFPSPYGIELKNKVQIIIDFKEPVDLKEALRAIFEVHSLFSLLMQSKQSIGVFSVIGAAGTQEQTETSVYLSLDQERNEDRLDF
jgi:hypothetical protein